MRSAARGRESAGGRTFLSPACMRSSHQHVERLLDQHVIVAPREKVADRREQERAEAALQRVMDDYLAGKIPVAMWESAVASHARRAGLVQPFQVIGEVPRHGGNVEPLELHGWRRLVAVDHIIVRPVGRGGRFDPERVTIIWRH